MPRAGSMVPSHQPPPQGRDATGQAATAARGQLRMGLAAALLVLAAVLAGCAEDKPPERLVVVATDTPEPRFAPPTIRAGVGQAVEFHVDSGRHSVVFAAAEGLSGCCSGDINPRQPWAVLFTMAGTYHYRCTVHDGMIGTVHVA